MEALPEDIWYSVAIHLDYETVIKICKETCTSNYFWMVKTIHDLKITEAQFDVTTSETGYGRETYIYYAGLHAVPIRGTEKYGQLFKLTTAAALTNDDRLIEYFYKLSMYQPIFAILANNNNQELLFRLAHKYPHSIHFDLMYAIIGAISGDHRDLIDRISQMSSFSQYALHKILRAGAETGNISLFKHLISIESLNNTDAIKRSIVGACAYGKVSMVDYLLSWGEIDPHTIDMALQAASEFGHPQLVNKMLGLGGNINYGLTGAARGGHLSLVLEFIDRGASNLTTAFIEAATTGQLLIMKKLMEMDDLSTAYNIALDWAIDRGHLEIVKFLLTKFTPSSIDGLPQRDQALEILNQIIPYISPTQYQTMLEYSADSGQLDVFQKLVALGANPLDERIMELAILRNNLNIQIALVKLGVDYRKYPYINSRFIPYLQTNFFKS